MYPSIMKATHLVARLAARLLVGGLLGATLVGCVSGGGANNPDVDPGPILTNVGPNVITATYADLDQAVAELLSRVNALQADPTDATLAAARSAWVDARSPWEASEGFLFGPADQLGLDPSLDTWPIDVVVIQRILDGPDALTRDFVAAQDVDSGLRGFHVVEFLLFGDTGAKTAADITAREFDYLVSAAQVLDEDASRLFTAWSPSGENFVAHVTGAGHVGSQFVSAKDALLTLSDALVGIADEVGTGKMQGPLDGGRMQVESRFSGNSKADFQNNIRSIRHIYEGTYAGTNGAGLTDMVGALDAELDAQVKREIEGALTAIGAIPGDFREAITDHPAAVSMAIDAVIDLKTTLEGVTARLSEAL